MALSRFWRTAQGTVVMGMLLGLSAATATAQAAGTQPTFCKDVALIFQQKCEACHRP